MKELLITQSLCKSCKWRGERSQLIYCDYCVLNGKSRIYVEGERSVSAGYCNTYELNTEKSSDWRKDFNLFNKI